MESMENAAAGPAAKDAQYANPDRLQAAAMRLN